VKRFGKDELVWVGIHKCMEAMLGISLYSYLYLKVAKTLCLSYYLLHFFFNKIREQGAELFLPGSKEGWEDGGRGVWGRGKRWPKQRIHM
jgi:hypothetical protein